MFGSRFSCVGVYDSTITALGSDCLPDTTCAGTYFLYFSDLSGPTSHAVWTFSDDGTLQGTDSDEEGNPGIFGPFSHQQGDWTYQSATIANVVSINFDLGGDDPDNFARTDATVEFSTDCSTITGDGELYFFAPDGDPQDVTTATNYGVFSVLFDFSGERLVVPSG